MCAIGKHNDLISLFQGKPGGVKMRFPQYAERHGGFFNDARSAVLPHGGKAAARLVNACFPRVKVDSQNVERCQRFIGGFHGKRGIYGLQCRIHGEFRPHELGKKGRGHHGVKCRVGAGAHAVAQNTVKMPSAVGKCFAGVAAQFFALAHAGSLMAAQAERGFFAHREQ